MSMKYDFYETPQPKGNKKKPRYHVRVVGSETISTKKIAKLINDCCSVTTSDVLAVLDALKTVAVFEMSRGNQIHLEGFGYFKPTLTCPPVKSTREIRAESISFKSIAFRPEISLKKQFRHVTVEKTQDKRHSRQYTEEEMDARLQRYFQKYTKLTCYDFQRYFGLTASTAARRLNALVEAGKLEKAGYPRFRLYVLPQSKQIEAAKQEEIQNL